jgi:hypothetical protein
VPLLRFGPDTVLVGGQHWSNMPLGPERAAVLHFKLDARLVNLAWSELERGQRATHDREYHAYAEALALHPDLAAFDPKESVEFTGSASLRELGVIGPIEDPEQSRIRIGALMTQAEVRLAAGDRDRGVALLERAAEIQFTGVADVLRVAAMHRAAGDHAAAAAALHILTLHLLWQIRLQASPALALRPWCHSSPSLLLCLNNCKGAWCFAGDAAAARAAEPLPDIAAGVQPAIKVACSKF